MRKIPENNDGGTIILYYARQYLLKMGGQLDKRIMWRRHMLYFQLFIIVCYLANKVLLLLSF